MMSGAQAAPVRVRAASSARSRWMSSGRVSPDAPTPTKLSRCLRAGVSAGNAATRSAITSSIVTPRRAASASSRRTTSGGSSIVTGTQRVYGRSTRAPIDHLCCCARSDPARNPLHRVPGVRTARRCECCHTCARAGRTLLQHAPVPSRTGVYRHVRGRGVDAGTWRGNGPCRANHTGVGRSSDGVDRHRVRVGAAGVAHGRGGRPALATRFASSNVTSIRSIPCDTRVTRSASRAGDVDDLRHRHRPSPGGLLRAYATYLSTTPSVHPGSAVS
jgi:hypothetical protein